MKRARIADHRATPQEKVAIGARARRANADAP
jgi:hypothetical protein